MRISGTPLANQLAVTEVAVLGRADAMNDAGAPDLVLQGREPDIECFCAQEGVHVSLYPTGYQMATLLFKQARETTWIDAA